MIREVENNDSKTTNYFEQTYPTLAEEFKKIQKEQYELFASKMLDYGIDNIALGTILENPDDIQLSLTGVWLRVNDKVNRIKNIIKHTPKIL
jgi:hypothetical protein